ncbi:MAG: ferredoxin--NADP reductase [Amylibacter sp.]|nr:ferredoxin--NADP reductase [Amylibacter sp.]
MTEQMPVTTEKAKPVLPDAQTVTSVTHYTDHLFAFRVTRPQSLRFRSGEFVMIGLMGDNGKPLLRAYSIASPSWDEELEFYSIKVQDGPLTSKLQHLKVGDKVILRPKPVGTLVLDALLPAKRMYFIATGTGIAPFASLMRDPDLYERYDEVIMCHTTRDVAELKYGADLIASLADDPLIGEFIDGKLRYYPSTTRQDSPKMGRMTTLLENGTLAADLGLPPLNPKTDRVMICGSIGLNNDMKTICEAAGLTEGSNSSPAEYVVEKAFVG